MATISTNGASTLSSEICLKKSIFWKSYSVSPPSEKSKLLYHKNYSADWIEIWSALYEGEAELFLSWV